MVLFLKSPSELESYNINQDLIFAHGRSLGGAVAIYMTGENPNFFRGLIVEHSFLSISAMVDVIYPLLYPIKNLILRIGWNSDEVVPDLNLPILYITGDKDEIVPYKQVTALHDLSTKAAFKDLVIFKGGRHNSSWYYNQDDYIKALNTFLRRCISEY